MIEKLYNTGDLSDAELKSLITSEDDGVSEKLALYADKVRNQHYGKKVFLRGLIEISSYCKNDCLYCGIRRGNKNAQRCRMNAEQILEAADIGYKLGFRTFVMQGGEDAYYTDDLMCDIIVEIKNRYPDCAVTLSLGERTYESYKKLRDAGTDRYLLRHESADCQLYKKLHPAEMTLDNRVKCLYNLRELGYQVGAVFMVGAPFQTVENIIADLRFLQELRPQMIGIGPFIPHHDTPFANEKGGTAKLTLRLLGIIRLMFPKVLLPATTALATISENGRIKGLQTGCNVIMPNISPKNMRDKYELYNNKLSSGSEAAEGLENLKKEVESAGYFISDERGDAAV